MILNDIKKGRISKSRKRVGRGKGSGKGKQSGKGHGGAISRSGHHVRPMFAGVALPLFMKFPKVGFGKRFARDYTTINTEDLGRYASGDTIDAERLLKDKVIKKMPYGLKVLGKGDLSVSLTVKAHAFSKSAEEKITAAGGTVVKVENAPKSGRKAASKAEDNTE